MRHLLKSWPRLSRGLKGRRLALLLDFDGTLAPLRDTPGKAVLPARTRRLLRELAARPDIALAIVSGRDLENLRRKTGLPGIIYSSNHGCRISGAGMNYSVPVPAGARKALARLRVRMNRELSGIKGVLIENKGFSAALHYRLVTARRMPEFNAAFWGLLAEQEWEDLEIKPGKKVVEFSVRAGCDKGKAVLRILRHLRGGAVPVYIGDDKTDEDAFKAIAGKGVSVRIGRSADSSARYYLNNPAELRAFLDTLKRRPVF